MDMDKDTQKLVVAFYYCVLGIRGQRLAKHLNISSATLARRLRDAKEEDFIKEAVFDSSISPEKLELIYPYLTDVNLAEKLQTFIGKQNLRRLIIVPKALEEEGKDPDANMKRVAGAAAIRLLNLFESGRMRITGVAFGRTLGAVLSKIQGLPVPKREIPEWIPLFGDLLAPPKTLVHSRGLEYTSTFLARDFASKLRSPVKMDENMVDTPRSVDNQYSLPFPAYLPYGLVKGPDMKEEEDSILEVEKLLKAIPAYKEIFGSGEDPSHREKEALVTKMDTMITGVGGIDDDSSTVWRIIKTPHDARYDLGAIYDKKELDKLRQEGAVGDICGTFVTEDRVDGFPDDSTIARINRRVLGPVVLADFQRCAARAQERLLFISTDLKLQKDLDECNVSDDLRREFESHGAELSQDVTFPETTDKKQDAQWRIADGLNNLNYIVKKEQNRLHFWREENPGVIIIASGARKARTVACAISNRCLTELICDFELAEELARIKGIEIENK